MIISVFCTQQGNDLSYKCPKCNKLHHHGASMQQYKSGQSAGSRVPHCDKYDFNTEIELIVTLNKNLRSSQ